MVGRFGLVSYENHDGASASGGSEKTKLDPRQNAAMQNDRFGLELSDESAGRRDNSKILGKRSSSASDSVGTLDRRSKLSAISGDECERLV